MSDPPEPNALVPVEAAPLDAYEQRYMEGQGAVLYRGKRPAPKWMQLLLGSTGLVGLLMFATPAWVTGLVLVPMGFLLWALFAVLRFTVSERAVKIQFGLFGPTIPTRAPPSTPSPAHWSTSCCTSPPSASRRPPAPPAVSCTPTRWRSSSRSSCPTPTSRSAIP